MTLSNSLYSSILKFDDVVSFVLSEEIQRKSSWDPSESGGALNMEGRRKSLVNGSGSVRSKSKRKSRMQCFFSMEYDHIKRDCPQRVNKNKGDSPNVVAVLA